MENAEKAAAAPTTQLTVVGRYENLPAWIKILFVVLSTLGTGLFIYSVFGWSVGGYVFVDVAYYFLLVALFGSTVFLILPFRRGNKKGRVPWYDFVMAGVLFGISFYCFLNGFEISYVGWSPPTTLQFILALIFCCLAVEAARRMAGMIFVILCVVAGLYPLITDYMPGLLWGFSMPFDEMVASYIYGKSGLVGLPMEVVGRILVGFLLFAAVLLGSGAGKFFLDLAMGLFGRYRGGPAKVAVVASGFFGSLSGSPYANIVATGSVTIPTMKRVGYPPHYAAAIEACASTGGVLMPPIMGGIIFVMVILLDIDYGTVIICAGIPSILYYFGLLMQVDAYAGRVGLKGLPREEIPSLWKTFKEGWQFIFAIAFLVFGLLYMRWAELAPVYGAGVMSLLSFVRRETCLTPRRLFQVMATTGQLTAQMIAIMLPVGLILGGLMNTGVTTAFTAAATTMGGEAVPLIIGIAIVTLYLMGMIGMGFIVYIVLAVTMAPALVILLGVPEISVHLFLIYYSLFAGLTAPVAVFAFIAAAMAGASPMKTAWKSMRLAMVIYFLPIFWLFEPALVFQGPAWKTAYLFALVMLGIVFLAGGMEGYLVKMGRLRLWERPPLVIAGLLIAFPEWMSTIGGAALAGVTLAMIVIRKRAMSAKLVTVGNLESNGGYNTDNDR